MELKIDADREHRQKLHIAMVCDPITDYTAGIFVSTIRFAERLRERGHTIIFIAARSPQNPQNNYFRGIKVYRFFSLLVPKTEKSFYISFPLPRQVKTILREEKIDIVHTLMAIPSTIIAMRAAKSLGIKIVAHSHTQPENVFLNVPRVIAFTQKPLNRIFYWYLSWVYRKANAIVYPSRFASKFFHRLNATIKNVVISNGVDREKFKKVDARPFFDRFNFPPTAKIILFVGRLHPEKCVDVLIKSLPYVIALAPGARACIMGAGHQDQELRKLAADLNLTKSITFLGKVSEEDLIMAYNASSVFVLPSLAELEGMVILEAMACGKPIVVANSKDSAARDFVDQNGFLFEPGNEKDLARQLIPILTNTDMQRAMSEKSLAKSAQYDITRSVSQLEDLYYSLLEK